MVRPAQAESLSASNSAFYEQLWSGAGLVRPDRYNTWPLISRLTAQAPARLEIGPGMRPRLPIAGTHFLDMSQAAVCKLGAAGGLASAGRITQLPYPDARFDLIAAFDIVEHEPDHIAALDEITRVLRPSGTLVLSVPLHQDRWTRFDQTVGHCRRYEPDELMRLLSARGLSVQQSALFGMQPRDGLFLKLACWFLEHRRREAIFWYNRLSGPLVRLFQRPLRLQPGLIDTRSVDEILLVCSH